jgi:hypothetical protein
MMKLQRVLFGFAFTLLISISVSAQRPTSIPAGSKVYVVPMGGFEDYLISAMRKKSVPLLVVANKDQADFEITGSAQSKSAGWAKILVVGDLRSSEKASVKVVNLHTGVVAFADSSNRGSAWRGTRSTAEKLAKYLKKYIEDEREYAAKQPVTTPLVAPFASSVDLNGTWKYEGQDVVVMQEGRAVKISLLKPGMCHGRPAPYFISGTLEGTRLTGKMILCTHEKLFSSCAMSATSEVDFVGAVREGVITGMATIPGTMMNTSRDGQCNGVSRDYKQDSQYPVVLNRGQQTADNAQNQRP